MDPWRYPWMCDVYIIVASNKTLVLLVIEKYKSSQMRKKCSMSIYKHGVLDWFYFYFSIPLQLTMNYTWVFNIRQNSLDRKIWQDYLLLLVSLDSITHFSCSLVVSVQHLAAMSDHKPATNKCFCYLVLLAWITCQPFLGAYAKLAPDWWFQLSEYCPLSSY